MFARGEPDTSAVGSLSSSDDFCQTMANLTTRIQCLESTVSGGDDPVGVGGPSKWPGLGRVMLLDVTVDGGLQVDEGMKPTALQASSRQLREEPSTAFSQELEVGVKWNLQRGCRASQARTLACLCAA